MDGDQEVAANVFDSITVCSHDSKTILVPEKNGEIDSAEAKVTLKAVLRTLFKRLM